MKVLLTTDGSTHSTTAMRTAGRLLRKDQWQADVLCVAPKMDLPKMSDQSPKADWVALQNQYEEQIKLEARKMLGANVTLLSAEGISANPIVEVGSAAKVILQKSLNYDVVVLGAHDKYSRGKPGLGPVAQRVIAQFSNSLLLARATDVERSMRVLVGVDGSLGSMQSLRFLAEYFNAAAAEITLMHVVETPWIKLGLERDWFGGGVEDRDSTGRFDRELRVEAEDVVENARLALERHSLSSQIIIEDGDPALELLSEAESGNYDLIVLGASSESDTKHSLLGSVSTRIVQDAVCSVFLTRRTE